MSLQNKVVLITGGSRGIGRATAKAFAEKGCHCIIIYHSNDTAATECLKMLPGENHSMIKANIAQANECRGLVSQVMKQYRKIDILVNNAGISEEHSMDMDSYDDWQEIWNRTIAINLTGPANLCFLVGKIMAKQRSGSIINVTSRGAFRGEPNNLVYGASKGGLNSFSQSLAKALGEHNISVTAVAPGFVSTDMGNKYISKDKDDSIINESPFRRVATPEEVADTICFLAKEESKFLSGGIVDINGASFLRM